jgi:hypothetical protein
MAALSRTVQIVDSEYGCRYLSAVKIRPQPVPTS